MLTGTEFFWLDGAKTSYNGLVCDFKFKFMHQILINLIKTTIFYLVYLRCGKTG